MENSKSLKPNPDFLVHNVVRNPQMLKAQLETSMKAMVSQGLLKRAEAEALTVALSSDAAAFQRNMKSTVEKLATTAQPSALVTFIAVNVGLTPVGTTTEADASTGTEIGGAVGIIVGAVIGGYFGGFPGAALGGAIGMQVGEAVAAVIEDSGSGGSGDGDGSEGGEGNGDSDGNGDGEGTGDGNGGDSEGGEDG